MRNLKNGGSKYSIIFTQITILFRDPLLRKLSKTFSKIDIY